MTTKPLLLLAAATLCCCIATLHGLPRRCLCLQPTANPVAVRVIKKIEVIPISGSCRRTEIIITRRNGSKVCVKPDTKWVNDLLSNLQRKNETSSTTMSPTATDNF